MGFSVFNSTVFPISMPTSLSLSLTNFENDKFMEYIFSQEEMDLLPEDGSDRDYKIHSNGTCGISAGFQYAVAERKGEEE